MAREITPTDAAAHVLAATPRLVSVTNLTAIGFSFSDGATRALVETQDGPEDVCEAARAYELDCTLMTVLRLALLLDPNPRVVSYQSVHRCLKRSEVVKALIRRVRAGSVLPVKTDARQPIEQFLKAYDKIDWGLHRRLRQFRNHGVAHLTSKGIEKRVERDELRRLVYSVATLGECLAPLTQAVPIRQDEITERSERAAEIWRTAFCQLCKDSG